MSLSTAGAKPELTRPSSAKTDLTCLSDILSQEPGAIGVSSQMFHAQNSLFETSQAITSMVRTRCLRIENRNFMAILFMLWASRSLSSGLLSDCLRQQLRF